MPTAWPAARWRWRLEGIGVIIAAITKAKRKNYRDQILARLADGGWERTSIDDDTDWWVDEHWKIRSVRQEFGMELVISFLVDPQYKGNDKSTAVWSITAATQCPTHHLNGANAVAELFMQKGRFNKNLATFIKDIGRHRDTRAKQDQGEDRASVITDGGS